MAKRKKGKQFENKHDLYRTTGALRRSGSFSLFSFDPTRSDKSSTSPISVPGAEVLRPLAREMVLLRGARDLLAALPAAECGHRDLSRQQK